MAPLTPIELDELRARVLQFLADTPYACSSIAPISGGSVNFVFRGLLCEPQTLPRSTTQDASPEAAARTVVIKHGAGFLFANRDFQLDVTRCFYEETMLHALNDFSSTTANITTPRLLLFDPKTSTQVLEDIPDATDLKSFLLQHANSQSPARPLGARAAASIGYGLGSWLRSLHDWSSGTVQENLRNQLARNAGMRELKCRVTDVAFQTLLENFPDLLDGRAPTLERVRHWMREDFEKPVLKTADGLEWGVIHGDFWTGNVLLPVQTSRSPVRLVVIDWEFAQIGHRAYDLGQMVGDLYERHHFHSVDSSLAILGEFVRGYRGSDGSLSDELAFRTVIHAGVHLIGRFTRRPPNGRLADPQDKLSGAMGLARDWILKGWERDREWFGRSALAPLFKRQQPEAYSGRATFSIS
ncbi:hypothetical protein VTK73DRAFT_8745 [Phialemonium thermophilum]|uniref:Aminoglycoside phosphotransferase domain-containing protein n=1 Tax=Phialemonium thermophilum TaxID=223376 RepID=A0ABR3W6I5_9PEZI